MNSVRALPPSLLSERFPFKIGEHVSESIKDYFQMCRVRFETLFSQGISGTDLVRLNTYWVDDLILPLFERAEWLFQEAHPEKQGRLALLALGGYGRQEMSLYSDIDLLFLYDPQKADALSSITEGVLYPLWDAKIPVGHATRTLDEAMLTFSSDLISATSLLDARFLVGDQALADAFFKKMKDWFLDPAHVSKFIEAKICEASERRKRYGDSVYILEPNLKEGGGGLRDIQTLLWAAKTKRGIFCFEDLEKARILNASSARELTEALDFFFRVRNALHLLAGRKQDQLAFSSQEDLGKKLGYLDQAGILAAERLMQAYYEHAANAKRITEFAIQLLLNVPLGDELQEKINQDILNVSNLDEAALDLLKAFIVAKKESRPVLEKVRILANEITPKLSRSFGEQKQVSALVRELFSDLLGLGSTLEELHSLRLLDKILPEFAEVLYRTQHDAYHIYTVDTHSIFAVAELSKLKAGIYDTEFPLFKQVLTECDREDLLAFGTFFHDIGKGKGKNHSIVGAEMAGHAAHRMRYSDEDRQTIEFLVKSHLVMPHLSQRRDLDDASLIAQFAKSMPTLSHLNMLFLLTWADLRAVGPKVWTPWKGTLLTELYKRTKAVLESGRTQPKHNNHVLQELRELVQKRLEGRLDQVFIGDFLKALPDKYFLSHSVEEIEEHCISIAKTGLDRIWVQTKTIEKEGVTELGLHLCGTQNTLAQVAGVLAAEELNILEVKQYLSKNGSLLLFVRFTDSEGRVLDEQRRLDRLFDTLFSVFEGRVRVSGLLEARQKPLWLQKKPARRFPGRIEIDNDISGYYTVIDIYADDRIGLLYQILNVFSRLGLSVDVSKISTKVDQVADTFYVKDIFGQKITQSDKINRIRSALMDIIEETT